MRVCIATLLVLVLPLAAVKTGSKDALGLGLDAESDSEAEGRPVMKVVKLLEDMNKQLNADLEDDKDVHEKMDCWCDTNEKEKSQAIEDGGIKIQTLKSALGEAAGSIAEMKVKRKDASEELRGDTKALNEASALRLKEKAAFGRDQSDTAKAITSCKNAVEVLKKHNPSLLEVRAAAVQLENSRVLSMGVGNNLQQAALKDFLHDAQSATSFLAIPGFKSHGSQSGQIFGILNQMLEDFEDHQQEIQAGEKKAESDFSALKSAKEGQISDGKKEILGLDGRLGNTGKQAAQDEKDLQATTKQLEDDTKFLSNLKTKCAEHDVEYDTRVKDRMTEITAVEKAIRVINDESSFKLFEGTVSFLQMSAAEAERDQSRRKSAASTLERAAAMTNSPVLALLAGRVRLDAFTQVKKAITGMVAELEKQQQDEIAHKDWCVKEANENTKATAAANDKKNTLTTKSSDLKAGIATLTNQIAAAKAAVAETKNQMKRASETREGANNAYQQTITDQRMTQMVLRKAETTLKQVYALLQQGQESHAHNSHRHAAGQPAFKAYKKNAGGNAVLAMLAGIITDAQTAEADAIKAEQNAQTTYESFMVDSNKALVKKAEEISTRSGNRAEKEEDASLTKKDLATTNKKISNLGAEKDDLAGACDFVIENFDKRQGARQAETDALKEAMSILSGAK